MECNTKTILDAKCPNFWKSTVLKILGKAFFIVLVSTFIYALFNKKVAYLNILKYMIFILLIPIYKIITQRKDEIYSIRITQDGNVLIKWNSWFVENEISINQEDISAKLEIHPFQRNGFFLKISHKKGSDKNEIKQFPSSIWNVDLMKKVVKSLNTIDEARAIKHGDGCL